eukprot:229425-Chlamydomonas_euryale.AAC.1
MLRENGVGSVTGERCRKCGGKTEVLRENGVGGVAGERCRKCGGKVQQEGVACRRQQGCAHAMCVCGRGGGGATRSVVQAGYGASLRQTPQRRQRWGL